MRKRFTSIITVLVVALMALFVSCEQNTSEPLASSISVRVADQTGARTITPEGNVNISHYVISVHNDAENIHQESGYLAKGAMFTVSNVPAGTWYAKVEAYIDRGSDTYVKVASDQSEPKAVAAGSSTVFDLVLDTLDAVTSGDVTVTLKMPTALSAESTAFWYQYTITGMTDEEFTYTSQLAQSTTGADGLATITLDADTLGLLQGAYRFEITVQNAETSPTLTRKGVDVMRLINGLEASGTIDLATYESDQSFDVTITDKIGDILTPTLEDGKEVYNLDGKDGNASLSVTLSEPLKANETIDWYVDGELDETVNTDEAASGKYTLTFTPGSHIVTAIVRDTDTLMAVGSVEEFKVTLTVAEIAAQIFTFRLNNDGESYRVTGLDALDGEFVMPEGGVLEIPASHQGKPVTSIGSEAFKGRTDIVGSVVIPDSVTEIGRYAFYGCQMLKTIVFSNASQLKKIQEGAFSGCFALTSISIPNTVTYIGSDAFNNCKSLQSITIPEGIATIEDGTFYGCTGLSEIILPSTLTAIKNDVNINYGAFQGCTALENIDIPRGVTEIGMYTFRDCSALASVNIPEGVVEIGANAFRDCSNLEMVKLPESLLIIREAAFRGCTSLKEITLPDSLETIEGCDNYSGDGSDMGGVFEGCTGLTSVKLPKNLISIEGRMFKGCSLLESINIPSTVTSIGPAAFWNCSALQNINIPEGVTQIKQRTFTNCSSLTNITIPDSVTSIENQAFWLCSSLETVEILNSSQLALIGYEAFANCSALANITIPDSVTSIKNSAFLYCTSLAEIYIPSVDSIGSSAFSYCSALADIFCEVSSMPEGWDDGWFQFDCYADVFWSVSREEYDAIMNNDSVPYEVPQPVISVNAGNATITCDKSFAHIYYTINGEAPTADNALYTKPFTVEAGRTVKAVAYFGNGIYSTVAEYVVE